MRRKWSRSDLQRIADLWQVEGLSMGQIASLYGQHCTRDMIASCLGRMGLFGKGKRVAKPYNTGPCVKQNLLVPR